MGEFSPKLTNSPILDCRLERLELMGQHHYPNPHASAPRDPLGRGPRENQAVCCQSVRRHCWRRAHAEAAPVAERLRVRSRPLLSSLLHYFPRHRKIGGFRTREDSVPFLPAKHDDLLPVAIETAVLCRPLCYRVCYPTR